MAVRKLGYSDSADSGRVRDLDQVRRQAASCQACPLWEIGTQTVFGAGPADARLMIIGEAPGQYEDQEGIPFVGPAGRLFDQALAQADIPRAEVYVTNVVKHRPWIVANGRPKNRSPKQSEITACRPWMQHELRVIAPEIVVCVGAPAAKEILGKDFRLMEHRGQWFSAEAIPNVMAIIHPAYVLMQPEDSFDRWKSVLFADVRLVGERFRAL